MRKDRKISDEEMLDKYISLGAELKMLCKISIFTFTRVSNCFGKTNKLSKRIEKLHNELEQLRSDLEDSMPYDTITKLCEENKIDPLNIFYSYESKNELNKKQMKLIYNIYLKDVLEDENNDKR